MTTIELPKTYEPAAAEAKHYSRWEAAKDLYVADPNAESEKYAIMIPPPNVTGSLHMGHALNMTLQDILTRAARMQGKNVLWLPGTDHAGIATQMVVERQLAEKQEDRRTLGREEFLKRVWTWKEESGSTITRQLRRLGALPDWSRERFTMDEGLNKAVRHIFVKLYKDGLIYRDKRLVNWDPKFQSSISDLEVQQKEIKGKLYYLRYPLTDGSGTITVATTRPETMLGDVAVAVHPEDERYAAFIGKKLKLPITGREIPIIADDYVKSEFGTGAVKITPAHDFNDYDMGKRHQLPLLNIFDNEARIIANADANVPQQYVGVDRFKAREQIIAQLEAEEALEKFEDHPHTVPHGDRSGVPVEPYLTDQWFVRADVLAKPALAAVENGETRFVPKNWENTYFEWLRNIQPWCISRQLWWGHQIPAWYDDEGNIYVAETEAEAIAQAGGKALRRDEDVLDTWFSSALWPFSTLGWPDQTPDMKAYYPGAVLVTGFDIIFFWVARMMMMGIYALGEVPFKDVYIHALVRDASGAKMSKSKGNVIDPLGIIDDYGADALRMTLTAMAAQGRDIKLSEQRIEGYRNFATKLWNAARFTQMNGCSYDPAFNPATVKEPINQWVIDSIQSTAEAVTLALSEYKFNEAANTLYQFIWGQYCDWYVELSKPLLQTEGHPAQEETRRTMMWVLKQALTLLHPIMPFVTEELWQQLFNADELLAAQAWPKLPASLQNPTAREKIENIITVISHIRATRQALNVPASAQIAARVSGADAAAQTALQDALPMIQRMARVSDMTFDQTPPQHGEAQIPLSSGTLLLPLEGLIDFAAESARLSKQADRLQKEIAGMEARLNNKEFVAGAPEEIIEEQREKLAAAQDNHEKLQQALRQISGK